MESVSVFPDRKMERLRGLLADDAADQAVDRISRWVEIGTLLLEIKTERCNGDTRRFGGWIEAHFPKLGKDDRAAYMGLARSPEAVAAAKREYAQMTSAEWVWRQVRHLESSESSEVSAQSGQGSDDAKKQAPEREKTTDAPAESAEKKSPETTVVGSRNAVSRWGETGERLFAWYSHATTRTTWNHLAVKRHGHEVAEFALDLLERGPLPAPITLEIKDPTARLLLPWLSSPFAKEYDISTPKRFERFKADVDLIMQSCWPYFAEGRRWDRGNECKKLFRRAIAERADQARQGDIAAMRELERRSVNTAGHPPIVVHSVELWPDGDQAEHLRLSYDEARFAFFLWREWDAAIACGIDPVRERGQFWQQRQRAFHGLNFPAGEKLSNFWHRAGAAMIQHPEGESRCEPLFRAR